MKLKRIILIAFLLAAVPVGRYLLEFHLGVKCLPYGICTIYALIFIVVGSILAGIATAVLVPVRDRIARVQLGFAALLVTLLLAWIAIPAGAVTYSHGFEHAVRQEPGLPQLQRWAETALREAHAGGMASTNPPSYWNPGDVLVVTDRLPSYLRNGIFASSGVSNFGPEVSVCTNGGRLGIHGECIAISWYLHGILVGAPGFKTDWNPWYCEELAPGVYSYHCMK